jgi:hypothetical protein
MMPGAWLGWRGVVVVGHGRDSTASAMGAASVRMTHRAGWPPLRLTSDRRLRCSWPHRGAFPQRAEITPAEPALGHASEGRCQCGSSWSVPAFSGRAPPTIWRAMTQTSPSSIRPMKGRQQKLGSERPDAGIRGASRSAHPSSLLGRRFASQPALPAEHSMVTVGAEVAVRHDAKPPPPTAPFHFYARVAGQE